MTFLIRRRGPVQNQYGHQDVAVKPKPRRAVENTLRRSNSQNALTATKLRENKRQCHRDTSHTAPPRVPPRTHSLNKIDKVENVQLQVLNYPEVDTQVVDSEHIYQPLILPQCSKTSTAHEYQSLTQLR